MEKLYFIRGVFKISDVFSGTINFWIAGLIMLVSCYIIALIVDNNLIRLLLQVFYGFFFYSGCLLILKDKFFLFLIDIIKNNYKNG